MTQMKKKSPVQIRVHLLLNRVEQTLRDIQATERSFGEHKPLEKF